MKKDSVQTGFGLCQLCGSFFVFLKDEGMSQKHGANKVSWTQSQRMQLCYSNPEKYVYM